MSRNRVATPASSVSVAQLDAEVIPAENGLDTPPLAVLEPLSEPDPPADAVRPCVKCGQPGYPYCKEHRASYQRDYVAQRLQMEANRGFAKGVESMRLMLAAEFGRLSKAVLSGKEIAFAITQAPAPLWPHPAKPGPESEPDPANAETSSGVNIMEPVQST